jgi:hypothetical protein
VGGTVNVHNVVIPVGAKIAEVLNSHPRTP